MVTSRVFDTIDALVSMLTAAGLTVWDGPVITGDLSDAVFIGYDADPEGDFAGALITQEWAGIGAKRRDEELEIPGAVVVLSGDVDWKKARDRAHAVFTVVETTLRATPSLGQAPPFVAGMRPTALFQEPVEQGNQLRITFTISVKTRT